MANNDCKQYSHIPQLISQLESVEQMTKSDKIRDNEMEMAQTMIMIDKRRYTG